MNEPAKTVGNQMVRGVVYRQIEAIDVDAIAFYLLENGSLVAVNAVIGTSVTIGFGTIIEEGCRIGDYVTIRDIVRIGDQTIIGDRVTINDRCIIEHECRIGNDCVIKYESYIGSINDLEGGTTIVPFSVVPSGTLDQYSKFKIKVNSGAVLISKDRKDKISIVREKGED